ncbi:hypothetical protein LCGC14_0608740 [marine sediment metagenome]|uniref:Uncharacterized protein n=1 Tax=marine sediment metagenome TaxID=412755 RepID=A0A0F9R8K4_9ZZZZ
MKDTLKEIMEDWLSDNGYIGLSNPDNINGPCACYIDSPIFMKGCIGAQPECQAIRDKVELID